MANIIKILKKYRFQILILLISVIIQVYVNLELPDYLAQIINKGIILSDQNFILKTGFKMIIIAFIGGIATIITGYQGAKIGSAFSRDLREKLYLKIQNFSITDFNKYTVSSLITRTTNDVQQIQMILIIVLRMVLSAPITGVSAIIKAYETAPSMIWIIAVSVAILMSVITFLIVYTVPKFDLIQKLTDKLNLVTRQNLTGIRVIRAFNNENLEMNKFKDVNEDILKINLFINRSLSIMRPMMMLIMNLTSVAVVWIGAQLLSELKIEIGNMLAFMQYSMQAIMSFLMISMVLVVLPRASVSIKRIEEILKIKKLRKENFKSVSFKKIKGKIEFKNVSFKYTNAEEPVLKDIKFTIHPGETTVIIGGTGSGKSTLVNLIPKFYEITEGKIEIDGLDINTVKNKDLRAQIALIPQKAFLFSGSIESNIKFGKKEATAENIWNALEIAQAKEFVQNLEKNIKSDISQLGTNLSGGQKQRLAIARAIIKNAPILIFDDSFSALDFQTELKLRRAIYKNLSKKTILITTQRISTAMSADQVIVLENGQIVGIGKHKDLVSKCKIYREIAESQLTNLNNHIKELNNN
ncbi:MAG TPA: ABC transporter ATP-binding protein [Candidatus Dojkabacteria bacterium]|nr:ABC transporter ATP-binding protein [Candidatus Dojkabacteria bacterium]